MILIKITFLSISWHNLPTWNRRSDLKYFLNDWLLNYSRFKNIFLFQHPGYFEHSHLQEAIHRKLSIYSIHCKKYWSFKRTFRNKTQTNAILINLKKRNLFLNLKRCVAKLKTSFYCIRKDQIICLIYDMSMKFLLKRAVLFTVFLPSTSVLKRGRNFIPF